MTYVKFVINAKEEAKNIPKIVELGGYNTLTSEAFKMLEWKTKKDIYPQVLKLHKKNKKYLIKIKNIYDKLWQRVGKEYIKNLEKIQGYKVKNEKICYIVPSLWANIADVLGRKNAFIVAAERQQNPLDFIMLHELTHLYYADFLSKKHLEEAMNSPLMEGVDHLILFKSPTNKLFKGIKYNDVNFVKNNKKFMKELENIWIKRKNFESFIKEAIKIQRKFKNIKIC